MSMYKQMPGTIITSYSDYVIIVIEFSGTTARQWLCVNFVHNLKVHVVKC